MANTTYSAEDFEVWNNYRQDLQPYLSNIYAQISPMLESADTILDLAGGDGHTHTMLPELSSRLVTLDIDESALGRLTDRWPDATVTQGDNAKLPFDDESFEAAIAINSVNRTADTQDEANEIARVLKPGGLTIFLYDIPYAFEDVIQEARAQRDDPNEYLDMPVINPRTRTVDQYVSIRPSALRLLASYGDPFINTLLDQIKELEKDVEDPTKIAASAKVFTRLATEVKLVIGEDAVDISEPYAPLQREKEAQRFKEHPDLDTEITILETDYRTEQVHHIDDRAISSLYVDELVFPHVIYKPDATTTRVRGRMPVFTARKHS